MSALARLLRARVVVYGLALFATPVLHGLCFPPTRLHWLAWIAFVPWFAAIRLARLGPALLITSWTTFLGAYLCATWLPTAVANYYAQPLIVGIVLFAGVWAVTVAPSVLLFTACYRALARRMAACRAGPLLPLLAGAVWAGAELGRVRVLVGDPFGLFGYSQVPFAPLVQIADVTGVYGISCILAAVNVALAELWLALAWKDRPPRAAVAGFGLAAGAVALVATYGLARLATPTELQPGAAPTRVAIVQADLDLGSQWKREFYGRNLDAYMRLTLQGLREQHPALVFWPESSMTFFLADEPLYQRAIGQVLLLNGVQLVAGGPRAVGSEPRHYYNTGFLLAPDGHIVAAYDKQRLLPFAEYFPFESVDLLRREFARVREFTPGGAAQLLPTVAGSAGVVICNEVMFGEMVADRVCAGAAFIVNLANDSWLGDAKYAEQVFDMARLRAIEERRYLVRASTSGPSGIIDPLGRVVVRTEPESRAVIAGTIAGRGALTLYGRFGDVFGVLCALLPLALLVALAARPFAAAR